MVTLRFTHYSPDEKGAGGAGQHDPNPAILPDIYAPLTRKEMIQSGMDVDPLTRDEYFLKKQMEESGANLPDVTAEDNGKLLGVTEGEWGKVDAPSGGETFICYISDITPTSSSTVYKDAAHTSTFTKSDLVALSEKLNNCEITNAFVKNGGEGITEHTWNIIGWKVWFSKGRASYDAKAYIVFCGVTYSAEDPAFVALTLGEYHD